MSVMEHSRHNAKWTSGIHSDKFPVFYSVLIRINLYRNRNFKRKKGSILVEIQEFSTRKRKPRVWDGENFETSNMKTSSVIKNQVQNSSRSCFYLFSKRENGISFTEPISKNFRISPNLPSRIFVHYQGYQKMLTEPKVCNLSLKVRNH